MSTVDMSGLHSNLPDNSHAARNERKQESVVEKRAEKVVKGRVRTKKNGVRKLTDVFISEDVVNVKSYIFLDVLVPAIKKAIYDIVVNSLDMSLYGGKGGSSKRSRTDRYGYTDYSNASRREDRHYDSRRAESRSYDDIILDSRAEAEMVLSHLDDIMDAYGIVRVMDLFDLVGETCPHTMHNYGWANIKNAKIVPVRGGGYCIDMPRATPINR